MESRARNGKAYAKFVVRLRSAVSAHIAKGYHVGRAAGRFLTAMASTKNGRFDYIFGTCRREKSRAVDRGTITTEPCLAPPSANRRASTAASQEGPRERSDRRLP
jgi:hypothetical protein